MSALNPSQARQSDCQLKGGSPKLLVQLRHELRIEHYALSTEAAYVDWAYRYILLHLLVAPRRTNSYLVRPDH